MENEIAIKENDQQTPARYYESDESEMYCAQSYADKQVNKLGVQVTCTYNNNKIKSN